MITRKLSLILLTLCLLHSPPLVAGDPSIQLESSDAVVVAVQSNDRMVTSMSMEISELNLESIEFSGERFDRFSLAGEPSTMTEGWPSLPMVSRAVLVPPTGGINIELKHVDCRIEDGLQPAIVPPLDGSPDLNLTGEPAEEFLAYDGFWPPEPVMVSEPAILRGHRIVQVTTCPVQYNPATGETRFNDRIEFDLVYGGEGRNEVLNPERPRPSRYVNRILQTLVVNPPEPSRDDLLSGSNLYIVPDVNDVDEALEPLLEWRRRQGHKVVVEHVSNNAGQNTIDDLIEEAYEDWDTPVEFVALVGDATTPIRVPAASVNGDYGYALIEGNDPLPDVAIGRISVGGLSDLRRVVNKLVSYEVSPPLNDRSWFLQGAVVAGYVHNGLGTVLVAKYVRKELLDLGFEEVRHWYHNEDGDIGGNQPFVTQCFDWGISIFHYRAYQAMNHLSQGVITSLPNTEGPWPPVLAISCNTGDFVSTNGCTEAFLRSRGGGVGAIGTATPGTSVQYNNIMSGGVWKGIYKDRLYAFGWGLNMGKYELWRSYHNFDNSYSNFMDWNNLMGDPGTHIWTGDPREMNVTHETELALGANRLTVRVEDEEEETAIPEALVCLYQPDNLHLTAYTDKDGIAEFILPTDDLEEGDLMVTVTKHNHLSYIEETIISEHDYFLGVEEWSIEDDEDGIPNPGESVELTLELANLGTEVPEGPVTVTVEALSAWVIVTSNPVEIEDIPEVGESVQVDVEVDIDDSAPDGEIILLAVNAADGANVWSSLAVLETESPRIEVLSFELDEEILNPGEFSDLDIMISNSGRQEIPEFTATIWCETDLLRIIRSEARYDALEPGASDTQTDGQYSINAHVFTIPGMEVELRLAVEAENGFRDTTSIMIPVGEVAHNTPFGPDKYGYVCFDSDDTDWEMAPVYEWIEIDSDIEDNQFEGENTGLRDSGDNQDRSEVVQLPFDFQYYGEVFDELTVCTNGWAAFGNQRDLADFRNRHIGQALGPNAQLCVFWDNLKLDNDSKILTYYDEEEGRFIVEWNKLHRLLDGGGSGEEETFQLILYDIERFPTYSGDGVIVFQYKDVVNGSTPAHRDTPYCTIGISNLDDSDGLEYTYWNQFHPGAKPFENGRRNSEIAIKFTTATQFVTGIMSGRVTDAEDGSPIENADITTSRGFWAITGENGDYEINDILIGDEYVVTVSAQGYNDSTRAGEDGQGYEILEDEVTVADFALLHPEFNIDIDHFDYQMLPDTSTETGFRLSNDGNGTLVFTSRYVYVFDDDGEERVRPGGPVRPVDRDEPDEAWDALLTWNATDSVSVDGDYRINGVIYVNGEWIVSGSNNSNDTENYFYKFDRWGNFIEAIVQPFAGFGAKDMEYCDELLWCTAGDGALYTVDLGNSEILSTWVTPNGVSLRNIAIDPATGFIYTSSITNQLFKLALVGDSVLTVEDSYTPLDPRDNEYIRRYGLAWFRDDPDGYNLYIISNKELDVDPGSPDISIFKMNPNTGEVIFLTALDYLDPTNRGRGGICITPKWNNLVWVIAAALDNPDGDMIGVFELAPNSSWIDYQPREATLLSTESVDFDIVIDTHGLEYGSYGVVIEFNHNADDGVTYVPVSLDVGLYGIPEQSEVPFEWSLGQNYPNPFNPLTTITYSLKYPGMAKLTVYDVMGREVARLIDGYQDAGSHRSVLNGRKLSAGVYFYKLDVSGFTAVRKMVLVK